MRTILPRTEKDIIIGTEPTSCKTADTFMMGVFIGGGASILFLNWAFGLRLL